MSFGLVSRGGGKVWGSLKIQITFFGKLLLGGSNAKK